MNWQEKLATLRAELEQAARELGELRALVLDAAGELGESGIVLDTGRRELRGDGWQVPLTPHELALMRLLLAEPERVFSRDELASRIYGEHQASQGRNIDAHMTRLRRKLPDQVADNIEGVYGGGYRFIERAAGRASHLCSSEARCAGRASQLCSSEARSSAPDGRLDVAMTGA